jgi:hypothetical protein
MADIERDIVLRVKSETEQAQGQFKNLKQELRSIENELNRMAESGDTGSAAFKKLQQRAGEVKDQIGDTKQAIKALSSDTFKLDAFAQGAQGIAGGFAAAQGALALFGTENKQVEEAIKKTQGAMALLQGVTAITNILQKESAFMLGVNTVAQKAYAFAVGSSTGAMKGFRIALASTGILIVVAAIVLAADAMGAFGDAEEEAEEKIKKTNEALKERKEGLDETMKTSQSYIDRTIDLIKTEEEIKTLSLDKEKNYKRINELQKEAIDLQLRQLGVELSTKQGLLTIDEELKLKEKIYRLQQDRSRLEIQFAMDEEARSEKRRQNAEKERKAAEEKKKELEKLRGYEAEYEEYLRKIREKNAKDFQDRTNKEYEDSIKSSDAYYDHLIVGAQLSNQETEKLELQKLENQLQIQKDYGLSTIEIEDQIALKKKAIKEKEAQDEKALFEKKKAIAMEWMQVTMDGLNALSQLNEAFSRKDMDGQRKAFERDKKFKLASAITATAMGVAQQIAVPKDQLTGMNFAKAAIVLATGIAQIKKISDTKFEGGGSPPSNNIGSNVSLQPSAESTTTPGINSTMLNLDAQGNLRQGPARTYVVESEISDKQRRSRQLSQTAILGK